MSIRGIFSCVGMSYHMDVIDEIKEENDEYRLPKKKLIEEYPGGTVYRYELPDHMKLEPDPENEHDPNAIKVTYHGQTVAFIKKEETEKVADLMAEGVPYRITGAGGEYKEVTEDDEIVEGEEPFEVCVIFQDAPAAAPKKKGMKTLLTILAVILLLMSLLLLIVTPVGGIIGIIFAVIVFIVGRRQ